MATANPRALVAHRDALAAFTRFVAQGRSGGLMNAALEMLVQVLPVTGAFAYRCDDRELVLVGDHNLPRTAKPWLARLSRADAGWFVAQQVARSQKATVAPAVAEAQMGESIRLALEDGGWRALAAAPIARGRELFGVLGLAADRPEILDEDTVLLLETMCSIIALGEDRERCAERVREHELGDSKTAQLATLGLIASTAACDLAPPLGAMQLQVQDQEVLLIELRAKLVAKLGAHAVDQLAELDELQALGEVLSAGLRRAQGVTSRLLSFGRESPHQPVDLARTLESAIEMLSPTIEAAGARLLCEGVPDAVMVEGRQELLQTLITQLLLYAKQDCLRATGRRPTIRVRLASEDTRHLLTVETSATGWRSGAPTFDAPLLRQPGTNAAAGLALAKQAVLAHGGHIEHGTSDLGGVLLRIVLPSSPRLPERKRRFGARPHALRGDEPRAPLPVILWIDSDELTASSMRHGIRSHRVLTAGTLARARATLARAAAPPSVIFCNVQLPDGHGLALHREAPPSLQDRFVFMTAGVVAAEAARYLLACGRPTLIMPITLDDIAQVLAAPNERSPSIAPTLAPPPPYGGDDRSSRLAERRQAATLDATPAAKHKGHT